MKTQLLLVLFLSIFLSGCLTTSPLTEQQKESIQNVYIINDIESVVYRKWGTTLFNNSDVQQIDTTIVSEGTDFLKAELRKRGYNVVEDATQADTIIEIDPVMPAIPYVKGVEGLGVIVQINVGINHGVQSQVSVCFRLKNAASQKQIQYHCSFVPGFSEIKRDYKSWSEYTAEEQNLLLENLRAYYLQEITAAIDAWGL